MAREKKIQASALNIRLTTEGHRPEDYISLFKDILRWNLSAKIASREWGQIIQFHEESSYVDDWCYYGDILRFTTIDGWFDMDTQEQVAKNEVRSVSIPPNLRPNGQRLSFLFFPESHLFVFQTYAGKKRMGPSSCLRMIDGLLSNSRVIEKYGNVEVTLVPDRDELDSAFRIHMLETLRLTIFRPNPDGFAKTEQKILGRLNSVNASGVDTSYRSVKGEGMTPDDELRSEADVAARNGRVYIKGKDEEGHKQEYKTDDHPLNDSVFYDEEVELETQAFSNFAKKIKDKFAEWVSNA